MIKVLLTIAALPNFVSIALQTWITNASGKHAGILRFYLTQVQRFVTRGEATTADHVMAHLMSPQCAWALREGTRIFAWRLGDEYKRLLERVIFAGKVGYLLDSAATDQAETLIRAGILVLVPGNRLCFSAPAVRQVVLLHYLAPARSPLQGVAVDDLKGFFLRALPRIDPVRLRESYALGADGFPSEACWQYVICCILNAALPEGCVSPEVGHVFDSKGRVDFYVNTSYGWGIELTREHDRLQQHYARFQPKGTYYRMLEQKVIRHWLLIDFCHEKPSSWIADDHVLHVVFAADTWDSAAVWQNGTRIDTVSFLGEVQESLRRGMSTLQVTPTTPMKSK